MISWLQEWLGVIDRFYLNDFIASRGSAFKLLLTPDASETARALADLRGLAEQRGYAFVRVSASETRVDRVDQIFFEIARQINWDTLMAEDADRFLRAQGYSLPDGADLTETEAIAAASGVESEQLRRDLESATTREIIHDRAMCKEFRTALAQLRRAQFFPRRVTPSDAEVLTGWLRGEKVSVRALKDLRIYSKIGRHNARDMLSALAHWLGKSNGKGLLIALDVSGVLAIRPKGWPPDPESQYYSRGAFLDTCEVLRQFIDEMDEIEHCLICAFAPAEFETGEKRSLVTYYALHNRLVNEVHDEERANLLAAMVRAADVCPRKEVRESE
jgi:hypothetical protein